MSLECNELFYYASFNIKVNYITVFYECYSSGHTPAICKLKIYSSGKTLGTIPLKNLILGWTTVLTDIAKKCFCFKAAMLKMLKK